MFEETTKGSNLLLVSQSKPNFFWGILNQKCVLNELYTNLD